MELLTRDYGEVQNGKDICDRVWDGKGTNPLIASSRQRSEKCD